jgi:hypothetical protein
MEEMELSASLMELGADQSEAQAISTSLLRIIGRAIQNDPKRALRPLSELAAVFSDTVCMLEGRDAWRAEGVLLRALDDDL